MRAAARAAATLAAAAAAWLLLVPSSAVAAPARWHFDFGTWRVSIFFEREEGRGDETRLLVEAAAGRFVFSSSQNPSFRDSTESVRALSSGETISRRLVLSAFEEIPACSSVRPPDACVVLMGRNGTLSAPISAFAGREGAALRERAAGLVSHGMRDALFALAPLLPSVAEFGSYSKDFLGLVWPERFREPQALRKGVRKPGCEFEARFGFPCSDEEKAREAKRFAGAAR